jgi:putative ABC transport system substrate-binding protein
LERRTILRALLASAFAPALAATTQPVRRAYRIGWLTPVVLEDHSRALRDALRALGYVEGQTVTFETRSADGDLELLPKLAAELVHLKVDIIIAATAPAILAARQATDSIPIVMAFWGASGLIDSGLVANLAHPGGNVTGVYMLGAEVDAKRVQLLLQAVPEARKVGVLDPGQLFTPTDVRNVAEATGIQLQVTAVGSGSEGYDQAFKSMADDHVEALVVPAFPRFVKEAPEIIELAAKRRIPAVYEWRSIVEKGGLMAYGPVSAELEERAASFVDRILKGAKPGSLPIEQPTKFRLIINLKTAKALGITIPQSLLLRADEMIQ